jgi:(1->4)-alpha-D-glucan 1-alpha-D-glucosylmutase
MISAHISKPLESKNNEARRRAGAIPSSTYRLQINSQFTLREVAEILDYLRDLGAGAVYSSPILAARAGSTHGYDVVDHSILNPEIAPAETLAILPQRLADADMGFVVDVVPNHMCIADGANWRWRDVLENGPSSLQSKFFDIDWRPPRVDLANKVLLPILGDQYGLVLENQEIQIEYVDGAFIARYWENTFPTAPRSWPGILNLVLQDLQETAGEGSSSVEELESIITAIGYLPLRTETDPDRIRERQREKGVIRQRLATLLQQSGETKVALDRALVRINGRKGDSASFDLLERFLAEQAYRLSFWRVAADEINYRRFFDVNELAAIRVEDPDVFAAVHEKVLDCIKAGWVTGLRIDHPDGLSDPVRYFEDLQDACAAAVSDGNEPPAERKEFGPCYIVAEKIMMGDERPRRTWAIHGTTGYGFLNDVNGLFVDPSAKATLTAFYEKFTGSLTPFHDLIYQSKRLILRVSMSSELNVLARQLDRICQQHRHTRDFTLDSLRFALREIISCFPVYRTYIREHQTTVEPEDRRHLQVALTEAASRNPASSGSVFEAIGQILLLEEPLGITTEQRAERRLFIMRFQQLTGPVMAKGVEDTAFYRRYPLASLNEVGGDPSAFGLSLDDFHQRTLERWRYWPQTMLSTATHDTKRSEDIRARLNVLSEIPEEWDAAVERWHVLNQRHRSRVEGLDAPEPNAEYLLYQTLVGAMPLQTALSDEEHRGFVRRIQAYLQKALREAKVHTSWVNPDIEYDAAIERFIDVILDPNPNNEFFADLTAFSHSIGHAGLYNSLSQLVVKLTSPGVPDIYQGNELWDFSLVDPDNRRPIDFNHRRTLLRSLASDDRESLLKDLMDTPEDGRVKLFLTKELLRFRRENHKFFRDAAYVPLRCFGDQRDHVITFSRSTADRILITAAGRFFAKLGYRQRLPVGDEVWQDSAIIVPNDRCDLTFRNVLTERIVKPAVYRGRTLLPLSEVFADLPVAVLATVDSGAPI